MRDSSVSLNVFKSRLKIHLEKESNAIPIQIASTWRDFRFKYTCVLLSFSKFLVKFEKTTYACINHLHSLYGKLSVFPLQYYSVVSFSQINFKFALNCFRGKIIFDKTRW